MVHTTLRKVALGIGQHHQGNAGRCPQVAICVAKVGIEIDGVSGLKQVFVAADGKPQGAIQDVEKLESLMHVRAALPFAAREELRQIRLELPFA
jgi:hypothetical protein